MPAGLPPGPSSALLAQLRYLRQPYDSFRRLAARYGDPLLVPGLGPDLVMTGSPEGIRTIFSADPLLFDTLSTEMLELFLGPGSLLVLAGEPHRAARKLQTPPFHGARMQAYAETIVRLTRARLGQIAAGQPFDSATLTRGISLDVIIETVFGVDDRAWMDRFHATVLAFLASFKPSFMIFKFMRVDWGAYGRFQRARRAVYDMLAEAIAARRAAGGDRPDVLGMLLAARYDDDTPVADAEVCDQLLTLVIAGYETTGIALQWALYALHHDEEALARLRAELDGAGAATLPRLPYLGAVCDETLRLWPLIPAVTRKLVAPLELCGYTVPAGHGVLACALLAHRRPDLYPEPDRFRPERFLARSFGPFEYLPFGGGARRCLGAAFALFEMKLVLGTLLGLGRFRLASTRPVPAAQRGAAVGPARPIMLVRE